MATLHFLHLFESKNRSYKILFYKKSKALMIIFTMKVLILDCQSLMFFSLLDIRKCNKRSHGKRKKRNLKRRNRHSLTFSDLSKKEGKYQESIQLSTTPDPGYQWESDNFTIRHHKREKERSTLSQQETTRHQ